MGQVGIAMDPGLPAQFVDRTIQRFRAYALRFVLCSPRQRARRAD
jgi:hypothetical protein